MALKSRTTARFSLLISPLTSLRTSQIWLLFTLVAACLNVNPAFAVGSPPGLPSFADFSRNVQNGQKDVLRGVYVDDLLALPVVQQPRENAVYVSSKDGEATQFGMASNFGNIGLLAHNNKAGKSFSQLKPGQEILLIYGDGRVEAFVVKSVLKFQALQPNDPYSSFKNLDKDETLTAEEMFSRVYKGDRHVTFQTCIAADGKLSWGRLFVVATPRENARAPRQPRS